MVLVELEPLGRPRGLPGCLGCERTTCPFWKQGQAASVKTTKDRPLLFVGASWLFEVKTTWWILHDEALLSLLGWTVGRTRQCRSHREYAMGGFRVVPSQKPCGCFPDLLPSAPRSAPPFRPRPSDRSGSQTWSEPDPNAALGTQHPPECHARRSRRAVGSS